MFVSTLLFISIQHNVTDIFYIASNMFVVCSSSSEDVAQNAYSRHGRKVAADIGEISLKEGSGAVLLQRLNTPDPVQ